MDMLFYSTFYFSNYKIFCELGGNDSMEKYIYPYSVHGDFVMPWKLPFRRVIAWGSKKLICLELDFMMCV